MILLSSNRYQNFIGATYGAALKNLSNKHGHKYLFNSDLDKLEKTNEKSIIFQIDSNECDERLDIIKEKIPNSKVIRIGMDSPYCKELSKEFMRKVDIHLNLMSKFVDKTKDFVESHITFCTISEKIIPLIKNDNFNKTWHGICLCNIQTHQRYEFFSSLKDKYFDILININEHNFKKISNLYSHTWFVIGHTMSPYPGVYDRSMKGFRDWIGAFCNTVLVYDNHPDIEKYFGDFVPVYDYNNIASLLKVTQKLICNPKKYIDTLEAQKSWVKDNTIELQLERFIK